MNALLFTLACIVVILIFCSGEIATWVVYGHPFKCNKEVQSNIEHEMKTGKLLDDGKPIFFITKNGYISQISSIFGNYYYSDYKKVVRIPKWSKIHKDLDIIFNAN